MGFDSKVHVSKTSSGVFITPDSSPTPDDAKNCILNREREASKSNTNIFWLSTSFKDETIQMCYEKYRLDCSLLLYKLNILVLVGGIINFANGLLSAFLLYSDLWVVKTLLILRIIVMLLFVYIGYRVNKSHQTNNFEQSDYRRNVLLTTKLTSWCLVFVSLVNGAMYVWKSSLPECNDTSEDTFYMYNCNEGYSVGGSAYLSAIVLLIGNTYLVAVFRCHHFWAIQISYCITCLSCFFAAALSPQPRQSILMLMYSLLLIFMYTNMEIDNWSVFSTLLTSEMNKRVQGDELKHVMDITP
jgi:hypothetical protein